jgi:hypothetical protein
MKQLNVEIRSYRNIVYKIVLRIFVTSEMQCFNFMTGKWNMIWKSVLHSTVHTIISGIF